MRYKKFLGGFKFEARLANDINRLSLAREDAMKRAYSHIDLDKRRKIARWRMAGLKMGIIAEKLGRHRSTISRELKSNVTARHR